MPKDIPAELRHYLASVVEANDRIVATKKRQMEPKLQDDDRPWLSDEQRNLAAQLRGFAAYYGEGDTPEAREASGEPVVRAMFEQIVKDDPSTWQTWQDVFSAAEHMNKAIAKVLG